MLIDVFERGHRPEGLGVGHESVDAPEPFQGRSGKRERTITIGRVQRLGDDVGGRQAERRDGGLEPLGLAAGQDELGALTGQELRAAVADPAAGSGDDDDLTLEAVRQPAHPECTSWKCSTTGAGS